MQSHSTGIRNLNFSEYKEIQIPFPPLPTQLAIVARLDSAMAEIDKARRQTESALASAREVWESTLESVFTRGGEEWEEKMLIEITSHLGDGLHGTPKYTENGEYYFINGNNLNH